MVTYSPQERIRKISPIIPKLCFISLALASSLSYIFASL